MFISACGFFIVSSEDKAIKVLIKSKIFINNIKNLYQQIVHSQNIIFYLGLALGTISLLEQPLVLPDLLHMRESLSEYCSH